MVPCRTIWFERKSGPRRRSGGRRLFSSLGLCETTISRRCIHSSERTNFMMDLNEKYWSLPDERKKWKPRPRTKYYYKIKECMFEPTVLRHRIYDPCIWSLNSYQRLLYLSISCVWLVSCTMNCVLSPHRFKSIEW
jgi:hypothetical protein